MFQRQSASNRILIQWQIKNTVAVKVAARSKKSWSLKISGFNQNSWDDFFSRMTLLLPASSLLSLLNRDDVRSGKCM